MSSTSSEPPADAAVDGPTERHRDLDRLLTFVDAIVAIAVTLLILPAVDRAARLADDGSSWHLLRHDGGLLFGFLLSFMVIGRLWFAQHRVVAGLMADDGRIGRLLLLWCLTIVFLPFPTAMVASTGDQPATKLLYIGTMAVSTFLLAMVSLTMQRHPELCRPDAAPTVRPALINTGLLVAALPLSLIPQIGFFALLLLFADHWIGSLWTRRDDRSADPTA